MEITAANFPLDRAGTYQKEALAIGHLSSDPILYVKGGWSKGTGYQTGVPLPEAPANGVKAALVEAGFDGVQVLRTRHFTMTDLTGNVYGCESGGGDQPLAYGQALTEDSIHDALDVLVSANDLTPLQQKTIVMALRGVRRKYTTQQAYQVTQEDVDSGNNRVSTVHQTIDGMNVETEIDVPVGGWITLQANGEVQYIEQAKWDMLGFHLLP